MSNFTVRIELYETGKDSEKVYAELHTEMGKEKFYRNIKEGYQSLKLPPAEYIGTNSGTTIQVLEIVKVTTRKVWKEFGIFITQTNQRWESYNLKPNT